jgi:hypothetical protein
MHGTVIRRKLRFGPFELSIGERMLRRDEEGSLRVHVAAIRKALGDGQFGNRYIANIKGRGYSFVGPVVRLEDSEDSGSNSSDFPGSVAALPPRLIGRKATVAEVRNRIRQARFVTLLGPGNKTTVAVAAGHDANVRLIAALVQALKARRGSHLKPGQKFIS